MTPKGKEIQAAALSLPPEDRRELSVLLTESLPDSGRAEWEKAWGAEALKRLRDIEEGRVETVDGEEVLRDLREFAG